MSPPSAFSDIAKAANDVSAWRPTRVTPKNKQRSSMLTLDCLDDSSLTRISTTLVPVASIFGSTVSNVCAVQLINCSSYL